MTGCGAEDPTKHRFSADGSREDDPVSTKNQWSLVGLEAQNHRANCKKARFPDDFGRYRVLQVYRCFGPGQEYLPTCHVIRKLNGHADPFA